MTTVDVESDQPQNFPAVDAAYGFVLPSYQLLAARFEAADNRVTTLLTLTVSLTLGAPVLAKALNPNVVLDTPLFISAVVVAVLCVGIGIYSRVTGSIVLPDPMVMYRKSLSRTERSFKLAQIYYAGENFNINTKSVEDKGNAAVAMMLAICLEASLLIAWITV